MTGVSDLKALLTKSIYVEAVMVGFVEQGCHGLHAVEKFACPVCQSGFAAGAFEH